MEITPDFVRDWIFSGQSLESPEPHIRVIPLSSQLGQD
jgi:hypothetical protein